MLLAKHFLEKSMDAINWNEIGIIVTRITAATCLIGRSRSCNGSSAPLSRAAEAASADRMPARIGPMILSRVQIAATPIVPAPTKRALERNTELAIAAASPAAEPALKYGTRPAQVMIMPVSIAMPTDNPTRCPTPISAMLSDVAAPVAPVPTRKYFASSPVISFIAISSDTAADASDVTRIVRSPLRFSSAPLASADPTRSTSAAAMPSGYGRSEPVTSARRSGTENITPSTPPVAHTAAVVTNGNPCQ